MLKEVQNIHNLNMQNILVGKMMYKIIYSNVSNERKSAEMSAIFCSNIDRTRKFFLEEKFNPRPPQPSWNLTEQWADENITPEILQHMKGKY